jgi:hypothetical protein
MQYLLLSWVWAKYYVGLLDLGLVYLGWSLGASKVLDSFSNWE